MKKYTRLITGLLILLLALTGCADTGSSEPVPGRKRKPHEVVRLTPTPTPTPTVALTATPTPTKAPTATPTPTKPLPSFHGINAAEYGFSRKEVIDYFCEIALTSEFTHGATVDYVRKWTVPIVVSINGYPTSEDLQLVDRLFEALNTVEGFPGISITDGVRKANLEIYFLPYKEYQERAVPAVGDENSNGFSTFWYRDFIINRGEIGIMNDMTRTNKNHVILEEIVQVLGLQNDSYMYPDSLFYQAYNEPQWASDLDWLLLRYLYLPEIKPGMKEDAVRALAETLIFE